MLSVEYDVAYGYWPAIVFVENLYVLVDVS
jgi:hypothetical protein